MEHQMIFQRYELKYLLDICQLAGGPGVHEASYGTGRIQP